MKKISKGEIATCCGVILSDMEYDNYVNLLEWVKLFKSCKEEYDKSYYDYLL